MATAPTSFIHREDSIATRLGVDRIWFRQHRTRDSFEVLWGFGPNRSILWSEAGVLWLAEQVEKSARRASPDAPGATAPAGALTSPWKPPLALLPEKAGALEVLVAVRTNFRNPRVIQATTPWGSVVNVIGVKGNLWWPGFKLLARERTREVWEFEGNPERPELGRRQPRHRTDNAWPRTGNR